MMLTYAAYLNEEDYALKISIYLENLLDDWQCENWIKIQQCKGKEFVLGPDKAPYDGWCREVVLSTAATLKGVINFMSGKC